MRAILKSFGLCFNSRSATSATTVVVLTACLGLGSSTAFAISIGGIDYAVLGMGGTASNPSSFQLYQSGTVVTGAVGQGPNTFVTHGIDAAINGTWYYDPVNNCGGLPCVSSGTTPVSVTGTVTGGFTQMSMAAIVAQANAQSAADAALAATQTFSTLSSGQTINLAPGQNVVKITGAVTISGGSTTLNLSCPVGSCSVVFQFAATGTTKNILTLSGTTINLIGGITPANVVWNLSGPSGASNDITISSSATVVGTFLAPNQNILVDNSTVNGEVIGGGNGALLSIHSTSTITVPPNLTVIPEPATLAMMGLGVTLCGALRRKRRTAHTRRT